MHVSELPWWQALARTCFWGKIWRRFEFIPAQSAFFFSKPCDACIVSSRQQASLRAGEWSAIVAS